MKKRQTSKMRKSVIQHEVQYLFKKTKKSDKIIRNNEMNVKKEEKYKLNYVKKCREFRNNMVKSFPIQNKRC
jgi:hypothetical protein